MIHFLMRANRHSLFRFCTSPWARNPIRPAPGCWHHDDVVPGTLERLCHGVCPHPSDTEPVDVSSMKFLFGLDTHFFPHLPTPTNPWLEIDDNLRHETRFYRWVRVHFPTDFRLLCTMDGGRGHMDDRFPDWIWPGGGLGICVLAPPVLQQMVCKCPETIFCELSTLSTISHQTSWLNYF